MSLESIIWVRMAKIVVSENLLWLVLTLTKSEPLLWTPASPCGLFTSLSCGAWGPAEPDSCREPLSGPPPSLFHHAFPPAPTVQG